MICSVHVSLGIVLVVMGCGMPYTGSDGTHFDGICGCLCLYRICRWNNAVVVCIEILKEINRLKTQFSFKAMGYIGIKMLNYRRPESNIYIHQHSTHPGASTKRVIAEPSTQKICTSNDTTQPDFKTGT